MYRPFLERGHVGPDSVARSETRTGTVDSGEATHPVNSVPTELRDRAKTTSHLGLDGVVPLRKRFVEVQSE
jgi:hypothetical protein